MVPNPLPPPAPHRRPRLWLRLVLWLLVPVVAFPVFTSGLLRPWVNRQLDLQLAETARLMMPLIELRLAEAPASAMVTGRVLPNPGSGEYIAWVVRDASGVIRMQSSDIDPAVFAAPRKPGRSHDFSNRILTVPSSDGRWTLELADPFGRRKEASRAAFNAVLLPVAVFGPVVVIAVMAAFRRRS